MRPDHVRCRPIRAHNGQTAGVPRAPDHGAIAALLDDIARAAARSLGRSASRRQSNLTRPVSVPESRWASRASSRMDP
jgi:hypothetical protein